MSRQEYFKTMQEEYNIEDDDTVIRIPFKNILEINDIELILRDNTSIRFMFAMITAAAPPSMRTADSDRMCEQEAMGSPRSRCSGQKAHHPDPRPGQSVAGKT